jgi:hypothetical protein
MEMFNILIGSLMGGNRSATKLRKKTVVNNIVTASETLSPEDSGRTNITGLINPSPMIGVKIFKIKKLDFRLNFIVKITWSYSKVLAIFNVEFLLEMPTMLHTLLESNGIL